MIPEPLKEFLTQIRSQKQADEAEITFFSANASQVKVFEGKQDAILTSSHQGLGLKLWQGKRWGFAYTERLDPDSLATALHLARGHAQVSPDDPCDRPQPQQAPPSAAAPHKNDTIPITALVRHALELEAGGRTAHPSIYNISDCVVTSSRNSFAIVNTLGLEEGFTRQTAWANLAVLARKSEGSETVNPWIERFADSVDTIDYAGMARFVGEEAQKRLTIAQPSAGEKIVVFAPEAGRTLLRRFEPAFSGESAVNHLTLLGDKLGLAVAARHVSLIDDGTAAPARHPIDAEGTPTQKTFLIEDGVLANFLHNTYSAAKLGQKNTANAYREMKLPRGILASNFSLAPGNLSQWDLLRHTGDGILVTELTGASASPVSGDFSFGAIGYEVTAGRLGRFLNNFTIAGNFFRVLQDIELVSDTVEFETPGMWGSTGSPYFSVKGLSVGTA